MPPKRAPVKAAAGAKAKYDRPGENGGKKSPLKRRPMKGYSQPSTGLRLFTNRLQDGVWTAFVANASPKGKVPFVQDLADKVKSKSRDSERLRVNRIVHRRNPLAPEGSDIELMDDEGIWPLRQFVHVVQEDEEDTEPAAADWGRTLAREVTELKAQSKYPKHCSYGGSLTSSNGPESVDTHLMNKDVVELVDTLYHDNIEDGTFWDDEDTVRKFFAHADDPRTLFFQLRE